MQRASDVRPLEPRDHAAWSQLWRQYQEFYEVRLSEEVSAETWSRLMEPTVPMHGLGATAGDRLVGIAHYIFHLSTWRRAPTCYLQDLFVHPEARGHGVARALVEAVYGAADAAGDGQVYWLTHGSNGPARRLYDTMAVNSGFILYERFAEASA